MHICLLTSARIFDIAYGGELKFTTSFGNWLSKHGIEVTLMGSGFAGIKTKHLSGPGYTNNQENYHKKKTTKAEKKIKVLYPPYSIYLMSRLAMSVLWIVKIMLVHSKFPITLIHAQDTGYSGLAAVIVGRILGIPIVISSHGIRHKSLESIICGRLRKLLLGIERGIDTFTIKNATSVIAINLAVKRYFEELIITDKKIIFIPIPIKVSRFEFSKQNRDEARMEMGIKENIRVVGFVGRFSAEKNLFALVTAFKKVLQKNSSVTLVLVGTGYLETEIRKYVQKQGIKDKVIFCGVRYDINKLLASFDVFVLPSHAEGFGAALLEAMAVGRASICSDIPTFREWVKHNHEALFVNPNDSQDIADAIELLCNDDSLRLKLGNNAKIKAREYDEEIVFPKILQHYGSMIKEK